MTSIGYFNQFQCFRWGSVDSSWWNSIVILSGIVDTRCKSFINYTIEKMKIRKNHALSSSVCPSVSSRHVTWIEWFSSFHRVAFQFIYSESFRRRNVSESNEQPFHSFARRRSCCKSVVDSGGDLLHKNLHRYVSLGDLFSSLMASRWHQSVDLTQFSVHCTKCSRIFNAIKKNEKFREIIAVLFDLKRLDRMCQMKKMCQMPRHPQDITTTPHHNEIEIRQQNAQINPKTCEKDEDNAEDYPFVCVCVSWRWWWWRLR